MIRLPHTRTRLRVAELCSDTQAERIRHLAAENRGLAADNGLMRSILRKLKGDGCARVSRWPTLPPELTVPYDVDLTPAEAALFDAITEECP